MSKVLSVLFPRTQCSKTAFFNDVTITSSLRIVVQVLMGHFTIIQSHGLSGMICAKNCQSCLNLSKLRPKYYRSFFLDIWVRGHSSSFKLVPIESLGVVFYSPSIVTMALSCTISEIKRDIGRKLWFFHTPHAFDAPVRVSPSEYCHPVWYGKTRMVGIPQNISMWQTDRRTDRHLPMA